MNGMTMDLFASAPETAAPAEAEYAKLVESLASDAGRKVFLKAMDQESKDELARAVAVVSLAKRDAYDRAISGESRSCIGWINHQPALSEAISRLNNALLDANAIPMAHGGVSRCLTAQIEGEQ